MYAHMCVCERCVHGHILLIQGSASTIGDDNVSGDVIVASPYYA